MGIRVAFPGECFNVYTHSAVRAVLRRRNNTDRLLLDTPPGEVSSMSWEAFDADRARLLRLMDFEALKAWIG